MMKMSLHLFLFTAAFMFVTEYWCMRPRTEKCCERECECTFQNGSVKADCSGQSLKYVPVCPEHGNDTNTYLLNKNNIERIEQDSFTRFLKLSKLDLSDNKIVFIHQNAFRNLRRLANLYLHGNKLMYKVTIYKPNMFEFLTSLANLTINDNENGGDKSLQYPDYALATLSSLQVLFIDGLRNETFGVGFSNLTALKKIIISSYRERCVMSVITNETFKFLPHLKEVQINCNLTFIERGSFRHQSGLTSLDLSFNTDLGFEGVTNATSGISNTLECLRISRIVPWDALCVVIPKTFAENLQNTSLCLLMANDNRIEVFEVGAISLLPNTLSEVYMRGHNIQFKKEYFSELSSLIGLTYVDLTGKDVRNFNYFQAPLHSLLRPELLGSLQNDNFIEPNYDLQTIPVPPNLINITHTYTQMYYNIGNFSVEANRLETVNFSRNLLTRWLGPIHGLEGLKNIDLSHNFAHTIKANFFTNFPYIESLDLSYNLLGHQIMEMESANAFANLTKLRFLDLTENFIQHLPPFIFSSLISMETLNLSRNRIHTLNIEISSLKFILCQSNNIQWLGEYARSQFDHISESGPLTLDFSGNPIACTCDNLQFLNWMLQSKKCGKITFGNLSNYYCYYSDGRNVTLEKLENVYNNVEQLCHSNVGFFIGMSFVFSGTFSLIIVGLLYRFRWKLRYFYYAARHRVNAVSSSDQNNHPYTYDAFLSFAEEDRDFVVNEVLNRLESESNLELNFHQRNFRPGRPIAENIIEAVKTSKRTLIILSKNFLESYWCIYELQMANMESVTTGRDVLLIVMIEHIPTRKIPTQILYHIQTDSYIQYPSEGDTDMFWRNLTDSLRR